MTDIRLPDAVRIVAEGRAYAREHPTYVGRIPTKDYDAAVDVVVAAVQALQAQVAELLPYAAAGADALDHREPYGLTTVPGPSHEGLCDAADRMLTRINAGEFDPGAPAHPLASPAVSGEVTEVVEWAIRWETHDGQAVNRLITLDLSAVPAADRPAAALGAADGYRRIFGCEFGAVPVRRTVTTVSGPWEVVQ